MFRAYLDASAAVKRYLPESGSAVVDHVHARFPPDRRIILSVGYAEVVAILVRKRNVGLLPAVQLPRIVVDVRRPAGAALRIDATGDLADRSLDFMDSYSINSTDAIILRSALDLAASLRARGDDILLISCDARLLKAAKAEGLTTFDPENQSIADLDALLGP
jgi:predicted nucleic acid-binding protein